MNESDYYYQKASQDRIYSDQKFESEMGFLNERQEYNLFAMLKPNVSKDGNQYCVLYGINLQEGVAGFGDSIYLAILDFNKQFTAKLPLP